MKEMIVIRALKDGVWEIGIVFESPDGKFIERGKICKV